MEQTKVYNTDEHGIVEARPLRKDSINLDHTYLNICDILESATNFERRCQSMSIFINFFIKCSSLK